MRLIDGIKKIAGIALLSTCCCMTSCDYLDVVPPEQAELGDAVTTTEATLGFLYSCYSGITGLNNPISFTGVEAASTDEYALQVANTIQVGQLTGWNTLTAANNTSAWKWGRCYQFIGQCYLFLSQLPQAQGVSEAQKQEWAAEANFLIAYYHFLVLAYNGPCPLTDSYIDMETPNNEYHGRYHFDYVVNWIAMKLDEAAKDLPASRNGTEWGRATSVVAKAIKARMLLYAASPLWNGSFPFPDWKNKNFETPGYGKELVSLEYDPSKWERALAACKEALELAESEGGCSLMTLEQGESMRKKQDIDYPYLPVDDVTEKFKQHVMLMRYVVTSRYNDGNREMVWGVWDGGDMENASLPLNVVQQNSGQWKSGYSAIAPFLNTVERFYTVNGKKPALDPAFAKEEAWFESAQIPDHTDVIKLNANREPRFYAWLSFDGDEYCNKLCSGKPLVIDLKKTTRQGYVRNSQNYPATGYLCKKYIQPDLNWANDNSSNYRSYPRPLIRLAELYLNLAECQAETGNTEAALSTLNVIRERAGVPALTTSDLTPEMPLREWVRNERFVELWGEGHRYYDARRWMIAPQVFAAGVRMALNIEEKENPTFEDLNKPVQIKQNYVWNNRLYLGPVFINEVYKNPQMVQAPEY